MATEVSGRDDMRFTLCGKDGTIHFLREYIMSEAFVYRWYDAPNDMYYLGKHKGSQDDGYTHSSTVWEHFTKDNIPEGVTREIIAEGTDEEMCVLEHKLLKFEKENGNWDRYYNESLGDPRYVDTSGENNPMWKGGITYDRKEYDRKRQQTPEYKEYQRKYRESEQYKERSKAWHKKYRESEQYKEYQKKYKESEEGRAKREKWLKKYRESEQYKEYQKKYRESEAGRASQKKYDSKRYGTPEFRAWAREYRAKNRDEMNRKQREYWAKNRDEMNRKQREYRARKKAEKQGAGTLDAFLK